MSPEIGHYALVLALALALIQSIVPIWGSRKGDATLMATAPSVALGQFAFVALSFAVRPTPIWSRTSRSRTSISTAIRPSR